MLEIPCQMRFIMHIIALLLLITFFLHCLYLGWLKLFDFYPQLKIWKFCHDIDRLHRYTMKIGRKWIPFIKFIQFPRFRKIKFELLFCKC